MDFRHPNGAHVAVFLPPRSAVFLTAESRYVWTHGNKQFQYWNIEMYRNVKYSLFASKQKKMTKVEEEKRKDKKRKEKFGKRHSIPQ